MAFQLAPVGGVFSSVVLVPVGVSNEVPFVIVLMYLLSMPLPPGGRPMRVSIYHNLIKLLTAVLTKQVN